MAVLKLGSRGADVLRIQGQLGLKQDGIFGKITEQFVRNFQQKQGLAVDGIVGTKTLEALNRVGTVSNIETTFTADGKFQLSQRSLDRLKGVHPDLVKVVMRAIQITPIDFMVIEGVRTMAQQKIYVAQGKSKTLKGRHIPDNNASKLGCAVDLGAFENGNLVWTWGAYEKLAKAVKQAAKEVGVPIEWGGDWKTLKDGPHFQLPWSVYR